MSEVKYEIKYDAAGFPMVKVEAIDAYVHWLPVTKIQFEIFICSAPDSRFDEHWYNEILDLNPRLSPNNINESNYYRAFITGIFPAEAQRYADWCGEDYSIPTDNEWMKIYQFFKSQSALPSTYVTHLNHLSERGQSLFKRIDSAVNRLLKTSNTEPRLYHQMLMRRGIIEWVRNTNNPRYPWGGLGETNKEFYGDMFTPEDGRAKVPHNPETERLFYYGFRLIKRI